MPVFHKTNAIQPEENAIAITVASIKQETEVLAIDDVDAVPIFNGEGNEKQTSAESPLVLYKGAWIDIENLLFQMRRSEKAREETELRLIELTKVNQEFESKSAKSKDKIKDLQSELKGCSRKLSDAETNLTSVNVSNLSVRDHKLELHFNLLNFAEKMFGISFNIGQCSR